MHGASSHLISNFSIHVLLISVVERNENKNSWKHYFKICAKLILQTFHKVCSNSISRSLANFPIHVWELLLAVHSRCLAGSGVVPIIIKSIRTNTSVGTNKKTSITLKIQDTSSSFCERNMYVLNCKVIESIEYQLARKLLLFKRHVVRSMTP